MKIYLAQINSSIGDFDGNCDKILREFAKAQEQNCDLAVFPEMVLTGYDARDLWLRDDFVLMAKKYLEKIVNATKSAKCAIILGSIFVEENRGVKKNYNAGLLLENGEVRAIAKKKTLPNFGVFDERRYFEAANSLSYINFHDKTLALLICEDMWDLKNHYLLQEQNFDFLLILNSSPFEIEKFEKRLKLAAELVEKVQKPLIYLNQIGGQDCLVFDGGSFILNENGEKLLQMSFFEEDFAVVDANWIAGQARNDDQVIRHCGLEAQSSCNDAQHQIYEACKLGLRDYVHKNGFKKVLLGMSGGIDSALVAAIAVDALGAKNVALYALPSRFSSQNSMDDALETAENLGLKLNVISIEETFEAMLKTLQNQDLSDLARENMQARIRGNILMALSNSSGALLLTTGNKSEMAVGYATLYGDMCGAFNPIKDLYKTQIYELAKFVNAKNQVIAPNILTKEPTAELRYDQKDSDSLPPYEILDKILYQLIEEKKSLENIVAMGYNRELVAKIAKMLKNSEYKRQQAAVGVKLSKMSFDRDWRMPVVNCYDF